MTRELRFLFICSGNSARSQMAEGLARAMSAGHVESYSAGTEPEPIHPLAIRAMAAETCPKWPTLPKASKA
jgi:protein-tyrosine-phosphatase